MLKFNKLRLTGFKSFVDSTELPIAEGLTGVIGPNGCGKSNLVEALKWVMGETSAKQMRGSGMEDVIFGGTATRPARNIAEVALSLDNAERSAPAMFNDADELEVSRRIEREKGSLYRTNGKDVRARDVQLLFADSATGARSTALVSQGRIGQVISAKPTDRRHLLEEAAGITGLHSRRHEAELRLRGAETNLERLDDVLSTLETQLQGLKKQSRQATRYKNISGHIRRAEATLFYLRWQAADGELAENREKLEAATRTVETLAGQVAGLTTAAADLANKLPPLRQAEAEAGAELHRLNVAREGLDEEERRIAEAREAAETRLLQVGADKERERTLAQDAEAATRNLEGERERITQAREGEAAARAEAKTNLDEINATVAEIEARLSELTERIASDEAKRASLERTVGEMTAREDRLNARKADIAREKAELEAAIAASAEIQAAEAALKDAQDAQGTARTAATDAEARRIEATKTAEAATADLHTAKAALARIEAEEAALTDVLGSADTDLFPPLIDAVTVEPGFETALGAALGEDLSAPTDEAAPAYWKTLSALANPPALPGGVRALGSHVNGTGALARRLSQVGVVETEADGHRLAADLQQGQRLVSREGALWRWDGFVASSGATTAAAARLEKRNRLKEIRGQIAPARDRVADADSRATEARAASEDAASAERTAREAVTRADEAYGQARATHTEVTEKTADTHSRLSTLTETAEGLETDLAETTERLAEARADMAALPDTDAMRADATAIRENLSIQKNEQSERQGAHAGLMRAEQERGERLEGITGELQSWTERREGALQRMAELDERETQVKAEIEELTQRPAQLVEQREALMTRIEASQARRTEAADRLAEAETTSAEAEKVLKAEEAKLHSGRENRIRIEGIVEQNVQQGNAIREMVRDKLDCAPDDLFEIAELKEGADLPELPAIERRVERLHRERDNMGPVNLRAEQEMTELNEQMETLQGERSDLVRAIDKLRQGINELNREGRERLLASFKEVDTHFRELFVHLFGGGRAHLALTDSEDPLEAGLEIMASPPGKRLQILSLLSGGEQALTALALLFAVFMTNPAPICVLDEVDAPLDDANVDRFCSLLEKMAKNGGTRFLVVTHHRMTMARMDRLYGVTMSERGVSQLVSVDLAQAEELKESA